VFRQRGKRFCPTLLCKSILTSVFAQGWNENSQFFLTFFKLFNQPFDNQAHLGLSYPCRYHIVTVGFCSLKTQDASASLMRFFYAYCFMVGVIWGASARRVLVYGLQTRITSAA
jgi:hypothetical protein